MQAHLVRHARQLGQRSAPRRYIKLCPQVFNAQRVNCRTEHVPNVMRVFETCLQQDDFSKTHPDACPDAF